MEFPLEFREVLPDNIIIQALLDIVFIQVLLVQILRRFRSIFSKISNI